MVVQRAFQEYSHQVLLHANSSASRIILRVNFSKQGRLVTVTMKSLFQEPINNISYLFELICWYCCCWARANSKLPKRCRNVHHEFKTSVLTDNRWKLILSVRCNSTLKYHAFTKTTPRLSGGHLTSPNGPFQTTAWYPKASRDTDVSIIVWVQYNSVGVQNNSVWVHYATVGLVTIVQYCC